MLTFHDGNARLGRRNFLQVGSLALGGLALSVFFGLWLLATGEVTLAVGCLVALAGFGAMLWSALTIDEPGPPRQQGRRRRRGE